MTRGLWSRKDLSASGPPLDPSPVGAGLHPSTVGLEQGAEESGGLEGKKSMAQE
ncbi:hypothetical protein FRC08_014943 [Ceratobasidium sp. 394]|nr:hypothetical protein FRC08_014943 [Ceratobasidium sp. 394]